MLVFKAFAMKERNAKKLASYPGKVGQGPIGGEAGFLRKILFRLALLGALAIPILETVVLIAIMWPFGVA
jgi:hypothetical protein